MEGLRASLVDSSLDDSPGISPVCGGDALDSSGEQDLDSTLAEA